jgi:hypothetical protein
MSHEDTNRNDDQALEQNLRAALRPVDPGTGFVGGVLARVAAERSGQVRTFRARAALSWGSFALAASIVAALLLAHQQQVRRTEQGLEARRQLIEALRVTGDKLDLASRMVNGA